MNDEHHDSILDAALEEWLGADAPPDLTVRILAASERRAADNGTHLSELRDHLLPPADFVDKWREGKRQRKLSRQPRMATPVYTPIVDPPLPVAAPPVAVGERPTRRRETEIAPAAPSWNGYLAVATLLLVAIGVASWAVWERRRGDAGRVAEQKPNPRVERLADVRPNRPTAENPHQDARPDVGPKKPSPEDRPAHRPPARGLAILAELPPVPPTEIAPQRSARPAGLVIATIDGEIAASWRQARLAPSPATTDETWCRRLYLRLLGRIPTYEELSGFTADSKPDKRERLVARLLQEPGYAEEWAAHWSSELTNILIGRRAGTRAEDTVSRGQLRESLRRALLDRRPFHRIAYDLVAATGASRPGQPDSNGAVNFLLAAAETPDTTPAERVSRSLLGRPLDGPLRTDFSAFFADMQIRREQNVARLLDVPSETSADGPPRYLDGRLVPPDAESEVGRRELLARLIAEDDDLAQATVNRVWAHFFRHGFVDPVDDLSGEASHPALLSALASDFRDHGHDLRELMRWVVLSRPFGLSSEPTPRNVVDRPRHQELGGPPLFTHYYVRPLSAEELFDSMRVATRPREVLEEREQLDQPRAAWLGRYLVEQDPNAELTLNGVTDSYQVLNEPLAEQAASGDQGTVLAEVVASGAPTRDKIERLFVAAIARRPTQSETGAALRLAKNRGNEASALGEIWWVLLNSREFLLDR